MIDVSFYRKWACQKMIESSQTNIWDGHWACAVLALIQLLEENLIPRQLEVSIRKHLDKIVGEHANKNIFREENEYKGFRADILELLIQNSHTCNAIGHDVIYTYYIVDLLSHSDVPATAELFNAMKKLLQDFKASGPGFVTINGNNSIIQPDGIPRTATRFQLTPASVLDLFHHFSRPSQMETDDMQLGHLLTHGHSIVELRQAWSEYAVGSLDGAFFARVDILAYANELEEIPTKYSPSDTKSMWNPLELPYWEQALVDSRHGHLYKYAYSYLKLNRMIECRPSDFRAFSRVL